MQKRWVLLITFQRFVSWDHFLLYIFHILRHFDRWLDAASELRHVHLRRRLRMHRCRQMLIHLGAAHASGLPVQAVLSAAAILLTSARLRGPHRLVKGADVNGGTWIRIGSSVKRQKSTLNAMVGLISLHVGRNIACWFGVDGLLYLTRIAVALGRCQCRNRAQWKFLILQSHGGSLTLMSCCISSFSNRGGSTARLLCAPSNGCFLDPIADVL